MLTGHRRTDYEEAPLKVIYAQMQFMASSPTTRARRIAPALDGEGVASDLFTADLSLDNHMDSLDNL